MLKGLAVFGLLAIVSLPPIPGQATNHRSDACDHPKNQAADGKTPPKSALTLIEKNCDSEKFKDDADCKAAKDKESTVVVSKLPTANIAIQRNADRDIPDWIAYGGSLLLVGVGFGGIFVGWHTLQWLRVQTKAAQDAAKAALNQIEMMKSKERARIAIEILPVGLLQIDPEGANFVRMRIENLGPTHAHNVRSSATARVVVKGFDRWDVDDLDDLILPKVIRADLPPIETYLPFIFLDEWIEEILEWESKLIIELRGVITYEDVFGVEHKTKFSYDMTVDKANQFGGFWTVISNYGWRPTHGDDDNKAT